MSLFAGRFPRDEVMPTERQIEYAESLCGWLSERGNASTDHYESAIQECTSLEAMSELIDEMKEELGYD